MPEFVERPADYWDAADLYDRANGRLFKEVEFALPVELTLDQQKALASEFAQHLTGAERLPYTLAIHAGGGENPHCHLMISEKKTIPSRTDSLTFAPQHLALLVVALHDT
ncbi:MobA/MobL family protein, partial [Serratia marcescens]|uniref:MobA/MobL family protein n=1 Tax=Serratia marcescens TaxID=615 RepID=UPI0021AC7A52